MEWQQFCLKQTLLFSSLIGPFCCLLRSIFMKISSPFSHEVILETFEKRSRFLASWTLLYISRPWTDKIFADLTSDWWQKNIFQNVKKLISRYQRIWGGNTEIGSCSTDQTFSLSGSSSALLPSYLAPDCWIDLMSNCRPVHFCIIPVSFFISNYQIDLSQYNLSYSWMGERSNVLPTRTE